MTNERLASMSRILGVLVYTILLVLISLFVFIENDEQQPLIEIFQINYLIPVLIYSAVPLWISYGFFILLSKFLNKIIAFAISLIIGIPLGFFLVGGFFGLMG